MKWHLVYEETDPPGGLEVSALTEVEGTIVRSYWTGHGDYPEFDLRQDDSGVSTWTRMGDETRYVTGLRARVAYVERPGPEGPFKEALRDGYQVIMRIHVEESDLREVGDGKHP
jgi:hypothetical protein